MPKFAVPALVLAAFAPALSAQTAPSPAPVATPAFDAAAAAQAVTALAGELEKTFLYPDVGRAYAAMLRTNLASGAYAGFTDARALAGRVSADLYAIHPDGHLRLRAPGDAGPRRAPPPANTATGAVTPAAPAGMPPLMEQAGWIAPGIAYVRFNAFMGDPQVLADFTAFLDSHAGAKTLIIDARTHRGGGAEEMNILFPRIYAKPATVMVLDTRESVTREQGEQPFPGLTRAAGPADLTRYEQRIVPARPASPLTQAKIYLLASGRTASAAEHLATVLKYTHRATLIGDTTAGAGNYGGTVQLPGGYSAFIPVGHSYFPGTKGWEGSGVEPDVKVAPERALVEALTRAGVAPAAAETLSASHMPSGPMVRRPPPKS